MRGAVTGAPTEQEKGESDDGGDRQRGAADKSRRVPQPALARRQEDRAQDLRPSDHHEREREDLDEAHQGQPPKPWSTSPTKWRSRFENRSVKKPPIGRRRAP